MGEVIQLFEVGFPHVHCGCCDEDKFRVRTAEKEGEGYFFDSLVCINCGNEISVFLKPCLEPNNIPG